jgi:hypothetical protein
MKFKLLNLTGALALGALLFASNAWAQLTSGNSDQLSIANPGNFTGVFVGNFAFSEANEAGASSTIFTNTTTTPISGGSVTNTVNGVATTDRLNLSGGLWILMEPGSLASELDFTLQGTGPGLVFPPTFSDLLAQLNLSSSQVSDIVGILSSTGSFVSTPPPGAVVGTLVFGVLNDGDPNLVSDVQLFVGEHLHFVPESSSASFTSIDVSAAFNGVGTSSGYTATFTSDSEGQTTIPDAGTTISLFGLGLAGLAFVGRTIT